VSPREAVTSEAAELVRVGDMLTDRQFAPARKAYEKLVSVHRESAAAFAGLGAACRALEDIPEAVTAFERAYRLYVERDEPVEAGLIACTLADIELSHLGGSAVASGWLARARHPLGTDPEHPGHVVLEGLSAYRALAYEKDPEPAREYIARSLAHAQRLSDTPAEITAKAFLGFTQVSLGELRDGFDLLDEATAAAVAGELPAPGDLDVYCLLISACERVRDFDRVEQWAGRVLSLATEAGSDGFATFARTQYASLLIWRGRWTEADAELDRVLKDAEGRPMTAAMGMVLRASLRRRQGRLDDALAELAPAEREPFRRAVRHMVLATRARIELDRGDGQAAADLTERYLRAVSARDVIERIDALETLVRARVVLGELDAARAVATELTSTAAVIPTDAVRGAVLATRAELSHAEGALTVAQEELEEAIDLLDAAGLTHDAVSARIALSGVLLEMGTTSSARALAEAALTGAEELGAARDAAAATAILRRLRGGAPAGSEGLTVREVEILRMVAEGLSNAQIADTLVLSPRTVERHVSNIYLKVGATGPAARTISVAHARRVGLVP